MFAADYLRRCKYKEKFANNIHCGLFFCKFTPFSSKSAIPAPVFFHYTSFYSFCLQMYETNKRNGRNGVTISSISEYLGKPTCLLFSTYLYYVFFQHLDNITMYISRYKMEKQTIPYTIFIIVKLNWCIDNS